ncbi:MAG TPA: hypothetical protein VMD78_10435 [Candidatus Baltobacteraceae bacterium]|nr:hypothetical protein [Candidatus Baltobacteraceae bacterium]
MKPVEVFDACYTRYRGLREWLKDSSSSVRALNLDTPSTGYQWRPTRARACEYVADFERIGRHALRRPEWKGRLNLFRTYFVQGVDYQQSVRLVGVSEGTFDYWFAQVKRTLGREFSRTGLFPPADYFRSRASATAERYLPASVAIAASCEEAPQQRDPQIERNSYQVLQQG